MVDEFSAFARMPSPVMREEDLGEICRQAVFLQQAAHPDDRVRRACCRRTPVRRSCDAPADRQALTNLLQNAAEAIEGRDSADGRPLPPGRIAIELRGRRERQGRRSGRGQRPRPAGRDASA